MTTEGYNGWTNRETWCLMLWVNNDEGLLIDAQDTVRQARKHGNDPATCLQDWAETLFTRSGYADTFGEPWPVALADIAAEIGSLWRVDWSEAADSIAEDMADDEAVA